MTSPFSPGFSSIGPREDWDSRRVRIGEEALRLLSRYSWPGNVRELENIISRAVLKASQQRHPAEFITIQPAHLAGDLGAALYVHEAEDHTRRQAIQGTVSLREEVRLFQIRLIEAALQRNNGNWAAAARDLAMNRSNLHNLATRLGLRKKKRRS